jgi:hypothetical protein
LASYNLCTVSKVPPQHSVKSAVISCDWIAELRTQGPRVHKKEPTGKTIVNSEVGLDFPSLQFWISLSPEPALAAAYIYI